MGRRRSPRKAAAKREWDRFVTNNQAMIVASGIPLAVLSSIDHFDELLSRGHLDHHVDPGNFRVDSLDAAQYHALVTLAESYFVAGYEWFTPLALRPADQEALRTRFALG